jgi:hypothetical protein
MNFALIDWLDEDDPDADQKEVVNKQKWVTLPISGKRLSTDELIQVDDETWADPDREAPWKIKVSVGRDAVKKITWRRIKSPSGAPSLHEIIRPMGKGLKEPDGNEATFIISWSDRPEVGKVEIGGKALHEGTCWRDHWPGLGISRRSDINFYERFVHLQAGPFKVPNRAWPRHTGFTEKPVDGWRYTLPDGRQVSLAGVSEKGRVAGYTFPRASDWRGYNPPSSAPSSDDISGLAGELVEIDRKGRLLALIGLAVRGLVSTTSPVRTCALLMGEMRSGKTSSVNFARGVTGPCGPGEPDGGEADASFDDTITRVEIKMNAVRDAPILVDDARKGETAYNTAEIVKTLLRLITSAAQNEPMRDRSNQSLGEPPGVTVKGALMITAENSLVGRLGESRLLRTVLLRYDRGEVDHETLRGEWRRLQSTLSAAGLAVMRAILRALSDRPQHELADAIAKADEIFFTWIRKSAINSAIPGAEPEFIASLAMRYSRLMTGMLMIDRACGSTDYQACNALAPHIGPLIRDQLDFIANGGGAAGVDREFMLGAIRWAFARGAYLLSPDGRPANQMPSAPGNILTRGYGWRDGAMMLTGNRLIGRYMRDGGGEYLIADVLFDYARDYAKSLGRELPLTTQTFPAAVVQLSLAQRRGDRNAPRVRIGEALYHALAIRDIPETSGNSGNKPEEQQQDQGPILFPLPDLEGALRGLAGTGFFQQNHDVTEFVPAVPAVSGGYPYRGNVHSLEERGNAASSPLQTAENRSNISAAIPLDKAQSNDANREAGLPGKGRSGDVYRLSMEPGATEGGKPFVFLISPRLTAALGNPQGPCCPVRAPQMAQDGRSAAERPIPPPRPPEAASEAPKPEPRHRRPRAFASPAAQSRQGLIVTLDATKVATASGASAIAVENHSSATDPAWVKKAKRGRAKSPGAALSAMLDWTKAKGGDRLYITRSWAMAAGLPEVRFISQAGLDDPFAELPEDSPWTLAHPGKLKWSMWATPKAGGSKIEILLSCYDHRTAIGETSAEELAHTLSLFRMATAASGKNGFAYRQGPGKTFVTIWEMLSKDRGAVDIACGLTPADYPPPAHADPEPVADIAWTRPPIETERNAKSCIVIDGNSQYLRAMAGMLCGVGLPEHVESPAFDKRRPGYWRASYHVNDWPETLPFPGWPLAPGVEGWLMTETVAFLIEEVGAAVEIAEAWLWEGARALDRLQAKLRDGLYFLKAEKAKGTPGAAGALSLLKATYKQGIGWWSRRDDRKLSTAQFHHRPHFRHGVIARSTASLLRDLRTKIGDVHPIAIAVDGFAFLIGDDNPDAFTASLGLPIGTRLGQYEVKRFFGARPMIEALDELHDPATAKDVKRLSAARAAVGALITGKDKADG